MSNANASSSLVSSTAIATAAKPHVRLVQGENYDGRPVVVDLKTGRKFIFRPTPTGKTVKVVVPTPEEKAQIEEARQRHLDAELARELRGDPRPKTRDELRKELIDEAIGHVRSVRGNDAAADRRRAAALRGAGWTLKGSSPRNAQDARFVKEGVFFDLRGSAEALAPPRKGGEFDVVAAKAAPRMEAGRKTNDPAEQRALRAAMRGSGGGQKAAQTTNPKKLAKMARKAAAKKGK